MNNATMQKSGWEEWVGVSERQWEGFALRSMQTSYCHHYRPLLCVKCVSESFHPFAFSFVRFRPTGLFLGASETACSRPFPGFLHAITKKWFKIKSLCLICTAHFIPRCQSGSLGLHKIKHDKIY
jgi:hypothetical protein